MNKRLLLTLFAFIVALSSFAQRFMETLDRGLIAVKQSSGVYVSWRIYGTEYYGVAYNLYRNGTKLNSTPLYVSNYTDTGGSSTSTYTVAAVVNGVEQPQCSAASVWGNDYLVIPKATRISNDGSTDITNDFEPNDATFGDIDGDGQMEVFIKEINDVDHSSSFSTSSIDFDRIEVYKLDGTLLWWIDCGPNLADFQHNETNIAVYDWDMDGKAEAIMRAADGTIIHMADGTTYEIGDKTKNYRADMVSTMSEKFIHSGDEFLVYMDGATGKPYYCGEYPLKRLEDGETDLNAAWGDGYGHRSSKHFFGAPYFDGKKASIFLARGIYTRHKMIAFDVDPATHKLTQRWRWDCNDSSSKWYGNGYHNYCVADVDWDGRDEIVFGSMVIDDDGLGLSTTGLKHGDALHCGDFDPYKHGQEIYACNESNPANNYRDATTSKIYYRLTGGSDDGRSLCGNFTNDVPGAIGFSGHDTFISCVKSAHVDALSNAIGVTMNFRTYWDGDLLEESFNGIATRNSNGAVYKYGNSSPLKTFSDTYTNNDTKATPCFQGDIFGDWREEIAMRDADNNLRIETTTIPTTNRIYTLLHDPQYRNAMVWQMNGYNQPPHVSYFVGEMEGITQAPPAPMVNGKVEIANGGTITSATDDKYILTDETGNATYSVANGAAPEIYFDNTPTWVKGHDNNDKIEYLTYTHNLTGGAFGGAMKLVKQGDGVLNLPNVTETYSGTTDVWAGTINFDGTMTNSRVWLNRFAELNSDGGVFNKGIEMNYASVLRPGKENNAGSITTDSLILNFGSKVIMDIYGSTTSADTINAKTLKIEKKDWENGPTYSTPVFFFTSHTENGATLPSGKYYLGTVNKVDGDLSNIVIEGLGDFKTTLELEGTKLYLNILGYEKESVTWTGSEGSDWNLDETKNFVNDNNEQVTYVTGDDVTFNDNATTFNVNITQPLTVNSITFDNTKAYTFDGDSIIGSPEVIKNNTGNVTFNNVNRVGNTTINGGTITVSSLANTIGSDYGSLGSTSSTITVDGGTLASNASLTTSQTVRVGENGATLSPASGTTFTLASGVKGVNTSNSILTKQGSGTLTINNGNTISKLIITQGSVNASELNAVSSLPSTVVLDGGTLYDVNSEGSYSTNATNFDVPSGKTSSLYLDPRSNYTGKLTGAGTLNVYAAGVRNYINGDWSSFTGTVVAGLSKRGTYDPTFYLSTTYGLPNGTLNVPSSVTIDNNGVTVPLGKLSGTGTLGGSGTYTLVSDEDYNFSPYVTASIVKQGSGQMRLITLGRITGKLTVEEGTLCFNNASASTLVNSGSTILSNTGAILGRGWLTSLIMNDNSQLTPCSYLSTANVGTIKTTTVLTENAGATINFIIASKTGNNISNSNLSVGKALTLKGKVNVTMLDTYTPAVGDTITLWTAQDYSGTPELNLPDISSYGLQWNTTNLFSKTGILTVTASTGINNIGENEDITCTVYSLTGLEVATFKTQKMNVKSEIKKQNLQEGTYVVKMQSKSAIATNKYVIK